MKNLAMDDESAINLLIESVRRFDCSGVPWPQIRFAIFGFWVGGKTEEMHKISSLKRSEQCFELWSSSNNGENPYEPLVKFFKSGGELGRWENRVLDIFCPSGNKFGYPEQTILKLAGIKQNA